MKRHGPALFILLLISFAVFYPALGGEFLRWDDREHLELNPFVSNGLWAEIWTRPYFGLYVPATYSIWTLIYKVWPSSIAFHLFNILVHSLNAWLVYLLLSERGRDRALIGACLFLIHPMQVETVAWISAGRDLIAGFFGLLTLFWLNQHRSFATYVFALLAKPTLVALPLAAYVFKPERRWKLAAMLGVGLAASLFTMWIQSDDLEVKSAAIDWWWRPLIALDALGFYIRKLLIPVKLAADYGRSPARVLAEHSYIYTLPVVAAVTAAMWFARVSRETWKGAGFAALMLVPVLGLIPFQAQSQSTVADRYVYLSLFGIALIAARSFDLPARRYTWVALLLLAAGLSHERARTWKTNHNFFTAMLEANPHSYAAASNLGVIEMFDRQGEKAEAHFRQAMTLSPNNVEAAANLASLLWVSERGHLILSELEPLLRDSLYIENNRTATKALSTLYRLVARAEIAAGDKEKATEYFCKFLELDPHNEEGRTEAMQFGIRCSY